MRRFKRDDIVLILVLGFVTSLTAGILTLALERHIHSYVYPQAESSPILHFCLSHHTRINLVAAALGMLVYFLIAWKSSSKSSSRQRTAFVLWGVGWLIQLLGVFFRHYLEKAAIHDIQAHTLLNGFSTSLLLFGALIIRRRTAWPFVLLLIAPILAAVFDIPTRSLPLALINMAVMVYFSLALLERFRDTSWVPAYFTFYVYLTYAAIQVLYPLDRYFEFMSRGRDAYTELAAGMQSTTIIEIARAQAKLITETMGYTLGAITKMGGALALLLVYIDALRTGSWSGKR